MWTFLTLYLTMHIVISIDIQTVLKFIILKLSAEYFPLKITFIRKIVNIHRHTKIILMDFVVHNCICVLWFLQISFEWFKIDVHYSYLVAYFLQKMMSIKQIFSVQGCTKLPRMFFSKHLLYLMCIMKLYCRVSFTENYVYGISG